MNRLSTILLIYQAAEDWVQGYTNAEISRKYNRGKTTVFRWKRSKHWTDAVAGREQQKRKSPARRPKGDELLAIKAAVDKWIGLGKPNATEFSAQTGMPLDRLEKWMALPFWESMRLHAEHREARRIHKEPVVKVGNKFPMHLLKQAVFLWLAGWSLPEIGPVINRRVPTLRDWMLTDAWAEQIEKIMLDKLLMHLIDTGFTIDQMYHQFFPHAR